MGTAFSRREPRRFDLPGGEVLVARRVHVVDQSDEVADLGARHVQQRPIPVGTAAGGTRSRPVPIGIGLSSCAGEHNPAGIGTIHLSEAHSQSSQRFSRTIGLPAGMAKAAWNSGTLESVPLTRYRGGGCRAHRAVIPGRGGVGAEERRLEDSGPKDDHVERRIIVGVDGLRRHLPLSPVPATSIAATSIPLS